MHCWRPGAARSLECLVVTRRDNVLVVPRRVKEGSGLCLSRRPKIAAGNKDMGKEFPILEKGAASKELRSVPVDAYKSTRCPPKLVTVSDDSAFHQRERLSVVRERTEPTPEETTVFCCWQHLYLSKTDWPSISRPSLAFCFCVFRSDRLPLRSAFEAYTIYS
jgi:hypothetical protein